MAQRKSKLNRNSVSVLLRKLANSQERLVEFALNEYPKEGYRDDFLAVKSLLELRDMIDYYLKKEEV